jgi:thermitase
MSATRTWVISLAVGIMCAVGSGPAAAGRPEHVPDEILVGFKGHVTEQQAEAVYHGQGAVKIEKLRNVNIHRIRVAPAALEAVMRALAHRPEVEFAEPNWRLAPDWVPNDPYFASAWHLPKIEAPASWDVAPRATVIVAVLDTGVDGTHPDLAAKMVPGFNFYSNNTVTADAMGHGTAVAGVIGAITNNGVGVASVAPLSRIMPIRTGDATGFSYASAIVNGMTWAVDHGAKVLNISINSVAGVSSIKTAAQYVRSKGGVVVAAAGNCACFDSTPENPYMISVSATVETDALASFSSRGNYVDIAAPGDHIWTTVRGGGYMMHYGTSFASPVVAGVVAVMMGANPDLAPATIETLLLANADDRGTAGRDTSYGYGRVNAARAVAAAAGVVASTPPADTTKPVVSISSPASGATVRGLTTVAIAASDNAAVLRTELYVDGQLYASDTSSPFSAVWDTTRMPNGSHSLVAKGYDAAGNAGVSGTVTVTASNGTTDTSPPVTQITTIWTQSPNFNATVTASDNVGVAKVELYIDGRLYGTSTSVPKTFTYALTSLSVGTHVFQSKAYDAAGNVGTSAPTSFTNGSLTSGSADTTRPATQITKIWIQGSYFLVTVAATDNVGVAKVELYMDGRILGTGIAGSWPRSFILALTKMSTGKHAFQSKAYDAAGNVGLSPVAYFTR